MASKVIFVIYLINEWVLFFEDIRC